MNRRLTIWLPVWIVAAYPRASGAHDGPPFPIVSDQRVGAYVVSIRTDPDATDDGSAGGQFWVQLQLADGEAADAGHDARDGGREARGAHRAHAVGSRRAGP